MARFAYRVAVALITAAAPTAGVAQVPVDRFWPKADVKRFAPEDLPAVETPAYYGELEKARALLHFGRYRQALYTSLQLPVDVDPVEAALLRGEAYGRLGKREHARSLLTLHADDVRVAVLLAEFDLADGDAAAAVARLRPIVERNPDAIVTRAALGSALEYLGDLDAAVALYKTFAEGDDSVLAKYEREGALGFESAEELTLAATAIDRWAAVTRQYESRQDLHDTVLSMLVSAYDTVDRDYWPAHLAAAQYLAAYGKSREASDEVKAARAANPNAVEVLLMSARFGGDDEGSAGIEGAVATLRELDPESTVADVLDAQHRLKLGAYDEALTAADRAAARQPRNVAALGTLAAVYAARVDFASADATLRKVDAVAPRDATAFVSVANACADPAVAAKYYDAAIERAPWWTEPQHLLGGVLLRDGEEDRARAVLSRAFAMDPYQARTVNGLRILDELAKFKEFESERFVFRYDERDDPIVPMYLAPGMDAMYDDLVKQFRFEPDRKPIVEVFPDAQGFSVRTAGVPGLESYGASLGRVMTVVAPRAGQTLGPFNWARVLKHEFTHSLNQAYTNHRCPRWLTEGLAVWQEQVPYRFPNVPPMMYEAAMKGELGDPASMRTNFPGEMGYMSGFWISRYLDEQIGWDAVIKLLTAYRDGKEDDAAFVAATGMDLAAFDVKFDAWAKDQVKGWGYDEETKERVTILEKEAEQLTRDGLDAKAIERWTEVKTLQPMNPLPDRRLAGLHLRQDRPADALPHLIASLPLELQDDRFAKRIARHYDSVGDTSNALKYAKAAIGIDPYDPDAHELAAGLYEKSGEAPLAKQEAEVAKLLRQRREK